MAGVTYSTDPTQIAPEQVGAFHQDSARRILADDLIRIPD